jgi:hypothetical protein
LGGGEKTALTAPVLPGCSTLETTCGVTSFPPFAISA